MENSKILSYLGLSSIDPGIYVIILVALILIVVILLICNIKQSKDLQTMKKRLKRFMRGRDAESLEDSIIELFEDNKYMRSATEKNKNDILNINRRMQKCFQKVGVIKYDALNQMGGKLSFAIALLDEDDNGYIINSVHGNEGCYAYTKVVKNGIPDVELGVEEKKALDMAMDI